MSRGSPELTAARKEEMIFACAELNETMSFREITIKEIPYVYQSAYDLTCTFLKKLLNGKET